MHKKTFHLLTLSGMPASDHEQLREEDLRKILNSTHPRKVIVAGPGTGKSYLFEKAIKSARKNGKTKFLALTFIGKLGDSLADDLAGLAETTTLHGFARRLVLSMSPKGWEYHPKISDTIREDLAVKGLVGGIGDAPYEERTRYYKAVGEQDVVHYALSICRKKETNIPIYDLILVDEFQDFNEVEADFIDALATKNEVILVGDDDQALYEFKGSSPKYIREKYHTSNTAFEKHTLRFCSRCPEVVVKAFHDVVGRFGLSDPGKPRIQKEYLCYLPAKEDGGKKLDSDLNPKLILSEDTAPGRIPYIIRHQLAEILETQKIRSALVIGEGRTCKGMLAKTARQLQDFGFKYVDHRFSERNKFSFKQEVVDGYRLLAAGKNDLLAWRLLASQLGRSERRKLIEEHYSDPQGFISAIPKTFRDTQKRNAEVLAKILSKPESARNQIADSSIGRLRDHILAEERKDREILIDQLISENKNLIRPLNSLEITVTNILGAKGLGADVVFLIGFDQGKLPLRSEAQESEIYQMLVALTRAKKRVYLVHTIGCQVSHFKDCLDGHIEKL